MQTSIPPIQKHPNIVLILADSMRAANVSCYGYHRPTTPHIDQLSMSGPRFSNAFVQAPFTVASTASILTGVYPSIHRLERYGQQLADDLITFPELLRRAGYYTAAFVANPNINHQSGLTRGFDSFTDGRPWYKRPRFMGPLVAWAENGGALNLEVRRRLKKIERDRRPFFFFVFYNDSHVPFSGLPRVLLPLIGSKIHSPDFETICYTDDEMERILQLYDQALRGADSRIGQLYEILNKADCLKNTVFIISADHGEGLDRRTERAGHGRLYENGIHVPLVFSGPGSRDGAGKTINNLVASLDLAPTICELAATGDHPQFQGHSLSAYLNGHSEPPVREYVISQYHDSWCVRTHQWKLIRRGVGISGPIAEVDAAVELYDLESDPAEDIDLADVYPDVVAELEGILNAAEQESLSGERAPKEFPLDESVVDRLRGLGYLD